MSDCGCKGHYHNGGCSDQNVVWWAGAPHPVPVNPTLEEIAAQEARNAERRKWPADFNTSILRVKVHYVHHTFPLATSEEMRSPAITEALARSMRILDP